MARHDVYRARRGGYLVDIQADFLSDMATRVVIPLMSAAAMRAFGTRLNPVFDIDGQNHVLITQAIGTVPRKELQEPVSSLKNHHDTILAAIDLLLTGF